MYVIFGLPSLQLMGVFNIGVDQMHFIIIKFEISAMIYCLLKQLDTSRAALLVACKRFNPFPHNDTPLGNKPFENTVEKGKIARNK